MNEHLAWFNQKRLETAAKALTKHGFDAVVVGTKEEARDKVLELIPAGASVGVGGSITIRELGLIQALEERGNTVYHHWRTFESREQEMEIRRKEVNADFFLSSSNAVTLEGELVNIDNAGNRVVGQIFGPSHSIVVAGVNKLVADVFEGIDRVKNVAAPPNARRLKRKTPCAETGQCNDCDSTDRICSVTAILERRPARMKMTVVLVGEPLGF